MTKLFDKMKRFGLHLLRKPFLNKFTYKYASKIFLFAKFYTIGNINNEAYWSRIHAKEATSPIGRFEDKVLELLKTIDFSGKKVLDVGCGRGIFLSQIPEAIERVGIDISHAAVAMAKEVGIDAYQRELPNIFLTEKKFDIITSFETLEHTRKWKEAIKEMVRCMKDDGYLIISVPFENKIVISEHVTYFDVDRLYHFLRKHVTVLEIKLLGPWLLFIATKKKQTYEDIHDYFLQ